MHHTLTRQCESVVRTTAELLVYISSCRFISEAVTHVLKATRLCVLMA